MNEVKNTIHAAEGGVTHETTNVTREQLVKAVEVAEAAYREIEKAAEAHLYETLEPLVLDGGKSELRIISYERAEVVVPDEKHGDYRFEVRYKKDGWKKDTVRRAGMNVAGYGSFTVSDAGMVRLMTLAGRVAESLKDIEWRMARFAWAAFDELRSAYEEACAELYCFDDEAEEAKEEAAKEEMRKRLVAGAVVEFNPDGRFSARCRVKKVTAKMVFWNSLDTNGRLGYSTSTTRIDEFARKLASGEWKIVAA